MTDERIPTKPEKVKHCSKCGRLLPANEDFFFKRKEGKAKLGSHCKDCIRDQKREYRKANADKIKAYKKKYYYENSDYIIKKSTTYYKNNVEGKKEYLSKYRSKNKKEISEKRKIGYKKNRKEIIKKSAQYAKENRESVIKRMRKYNNGYVSMLSNISKKISTYEKIRDVNGLLEVKCSYCGSFFNPTQADVRSRLKSCEGNGIGENRLYCSDSCKQSCPIYKKIKFPKGHKKGTSREVNPLVRQKVFERDGFKCVTCGLGTKDKTQIHCHHIEGATQNPLLSNDIENCITLCKYHHKEVHKKPGCKYHELKCKS